MQQKSSDSRDDGGNNSDDDNNNNNKKGAADDGKVNPRSGVGKNGNKNRSTRPAAIGAAGAGTNQNQRTQSPQTSTPGNPRGSSQESYRNATVDRQQIQEVKTERADLLEKVRRYDP